MTDQELIKELVKRQLVGEDVADRALRDGAFVNRSAEEILYERKTVEESVVAGVKSELLGIPYKKVNPESIGEELLKIIPQETAVTYRVVPIEKQKKLLVVGMFHPDDLRAQEALKFIAKKEGVSLGIYLITFSDLNAVLRKYAPFESELQAAVREIGKVVEEDEQVELESGGSRDDAPIIKIVASTLREAVESNASDIHIEPQKNRLRIRFRVDGKLKEISSLPPSLSQPVLSRVKVLARMKLDESRIPQDGRFRTFIFGRDVDYRVATFPTPSGEKTAIRVLDSATGLKGLDQLGLSAWHSAIVTEAVTRPYGMVLISGPTGSGKSTTLYAILQRFNSDAYNVVTLEDPVEYFMDGVNQSQVRPEIGYTFASGLRQILRQDPDVIMVGEVRDSETADLAVNAALTGHIVLSTIHTNNAIGVVPRLVDLKVEPFLLSSALNLMLSQRLVLHLCPECKVPRPASQEISKSIDAALHALPADVQKIVSYRSPYTIYKAEPKPTCKICKGKGSVGRLALFEMFRMTRELGDAITKGFTEGTILDEAHRQGFISLRQDGILKALEGKVLIEEVITETTETFRGEA
ncbi:MAG: ATPase, T2SS/T4P/T4SS family [Patescibacteria group bacterium]